ncbi:flavin-containing monooxygenase [Aspergillus affinis]|uniref:flavin-containing monooxygenase n=1 Tax=Aspergillus affinis TaxID=1070780 RepID=UPI0022FF17E4|nr:steroid monooxygenase [Aspergillus affinis]KAI9035040.1 steroid monooxygenase [Aspergillus affinis]
MLLLTGPLSIMKTDIREFADRQGSSGPNADNLELDALIVGAGFSGIYYLHELRKLGLKAIIYEAGHDIGGTWRWNCYPGARVDSEIPEYQFSIPETWKDWTWSTNYPAYDEIRAYFDHVERVLNIKKDCSFGTFVNGASFDTPSGRWQITTTDGRKASAKYLIVSTGFAAKRHIPDWPGIESFRGVIHHSSFWPEEGVDLKGKRVGVIGTGASGVQLTQALGPVAGSLKVFQRTPNLAVPMRRRDLTVEEQEQLKPIYPELFSLREKAFGGFHYTFSERGTFEDNEQEQQAFLGRLWQLGGFRLWVANYKDSLHDAKANRVVYDFWAERVRQRIDDPVTRDLLAPLEPLHPWGVKRPSLEVDYFEQFNRPTVELVDIRNNAIERITETGLQLADGTHYDLDAICIATGFDVSTGALVNMGLRSIEGRELKDEWAASVQTYLGMTISGYPNLFTTYGPHAPTALSNGPTCIEVQGRWVIDAIKQMERRGIKSINATGAAAHAWKHRIEALSNPTLFPTTRSTYMGGTFPGKPFEQLNWTGGIPAYHAEIRPVLPSLKGFDVEML